MTVGGFVRSSVVNVMRPTKRLLVIQAVALMLAAGVCVASAGATRTGSKRGPLLPALWTRCSLHVKVSGFEVSPVEVRHLSCAQAKQAIERASVLLSPGGPIFSTRGYACRSRNILPRVDPSPVELPAAEFCSAARRGLSFVWD